MAVSTKAKNYKHFYVDLQAITKRKKEELDNRLTELDKKVRVQKDEITERIPMYKSDFGIDLTKYIEFVDNRYSTGVFYKTAQGLFTNKKNNYELVGDLCHLFDLAKTQKEIYEINKELVKCDTILQLKISQYTELVRKFYTEVHKKLVLEGAGYAFSGRLGWICINRIKIKTTKKRINYQATKEKEIELLKQGKRIYNTKEAQFCKDNGLEYKAVDKRVYLNDEFFYKLELLSCALPKAKILRLHVNNHVTRDLKKYKYADLLKMCNDDPNKICELNIDVIKKVTLCNKVDKILYTKFIRNENQKSVRNVTTDRKNRQRFQHK